MRIPNAPGIVGRTIARPKPAADAVDVHLARRTAVLAVRSRLRARLLLRRTSVEVDRRVADRSASEGRVVEGRVVR